MVPKQCFNLICCSLEDKDSAKGVRKCIIELIALLLPISTSQMLPPPLSPAGSISWQD